MRLGQQAGMRAMPISRVAIIVLGDLGRSPRMQYHAAAFANGGAEVEVIAFRGKEPIGELTEAPNVRLHLMPALEISDRVPAIVRPFVALLRLALHSLLLGWHLLSMPRTELLLVQNPPAFPAVPLTLVLGRLRGSRVVIDWHNLTSAMAALRTRSASLLAVVRRAEEVAGRSADAALAVTEDLRDHLRARGVKNVEVFRDFAWSPAAAVPRIGRGPLTVVTATSWSGDEQLEWLLDAAAKADAQLDVNSRISIVITGDGPRRQAFDSRRASMTLQNIEILTTWLDSTVYRSTLAQADCGISLHRSASGLDFPMKIADMRGASLPVLACDSGGASDRRLDGEPGIRFFTSAAELSRQLVSFARRPELVRAFRSEVPRDLPSWTDEWQRVALPFMTERGAA